MNCINNLRSKMEYYCEYYKYIRVNKKASKLMCILEKRGTIGYSIETEDGRMKLEWSKKKI